jgi:hypothetical protein
MTESLSSISSSKRITFNTGRFASKIDGRSCLNPISEVEDLQYKMAMIAEMRARPAANTFSQNENLPIKHEDSEQGPSPQIHVAKEKPKEVPTQLKVLIPKEVSFLSTNYNTPEK